MPVGAFSFRRESTQRPFDTTPPSHPTGAHQPHPNEPLPTPPIHTSRIFRRHIAFVPGPAWALERTPQPPRDV